MRAMNSPNRLCVTGIFVLSFCLSVPVTTHSQGNSNKRTNSRVRQRQVNQPSKTQEPYSEPPSTKPLTPRQIVDRVLPSTVLIMTEDENGLPVAQGSGFFYKSGLVVTNLHVFTRASQAYVKVLNGGITYKVTEVAGIDMRRDLCVVKVEDNSTQPLLLNTSSSPSIGDEVFVVGNPKGLEGSVSKGIVSSIRKDVGLIQIDAAISPGSSGGVVVNDRAEAVGIVVSSLTSGQNLNFAIPIEYLSSLKLNFKVPVVVAGAFSLKDRDKDKLKGLVRSVTVVHAYFDIDPRSGKYFEKPTQMEMKSVYDLDGNKVELWNYLSGKFYVKYIYTYDGNGFKTRQVEEYGIGTRKEYEFTLAESMSEKLDKKMFSGSSETPFSKSVYDRDGNEIEVTFKLTTGWEKHVYTYGRHGFVAEQRSYLDDKLKSVDRYTYETDERGNWIKRYETSYSSKYPELGFTPSAVTYQNVEYFGQ
jgi:hypothetical protein